MTFIENRLFLFLSHFDIKIFETEIAYLIHASKNNLIIL